MNDLQVKIGGSAEQLKAAVNQAKAEISSLDKTAKNAGAGGLGGLTKDAPKLIGQFKEIGSKVQGLGGALGGLVPALGPMSLAVAGITAAVNYGINQWREYQAVVASLEQTFKDGEISGRKYLDAVTGKNLKPQEDNARKRLIELEQERKRINAEQKADDNRAESINRGARIGGALGPVGAGAGALLGGLKEDKDVLTRLNERQKRLNEIQSEQAAQIEVIKKAEADKRKAESDAGVEASKVAAKAFEDERKRNEEAKKRYNEASFSTASEEEQLVILRDQASELSKIAEAKAGSSTAQIEAATEYLKIEKQISDILEKRADKQKTAAEKEAAKQKELKQIAYERVWGEATAAQRLAQAQKEYLAAKVKAEKDANTDNLIALEKAKTKVLEQKKAVQDLNAEKGKGNEEKKDRPRTPDGKVIVSEEDRARSDADKARNAGFQSETDRSRIKVNGASLAKPRVPSVDSGKTSANEAHNGSTWQQDIKDIRGYLAPKNI
jgi:hypothetical protein